MPGVTTNKRIKNTRVSRPFIIGSKAWNLTPENHSGPLPEGHTKGWTVYVKGLESGPDIGTWLKKVQFKLHHTYNDASRTVETQPFEVSETGYGEFDIELRLYFDSASGEKAQYRFHRLRLEPFGDEQQIARQVRENMTVAEVCEIVEFNEPSRDFYAKMTGEEQFTAAAAAASAAAAADGPGSAGGKKKRPATSEAAAGSRGAKKNATTGRELSASLPLKGTDTSPWGKDMESRMIEMLTDAKRQLDIQIGTERQKAETRHKRIAQLNAT